MKTEDVFFLPLERHMLAVGGTIKVFVAGMQAIQVHELKDPWIFLLILNLSLSLNKSYDSLSAV